LPFVRGGRRGPLAGRAPAATAAARQPASFQDAGFFYFFSIYLGVAWLAVAGNRHAAGADPHAGQVAARVYANIA